ncbi:MAG: hypothetical protein VXW87_00550 [Pseudomonadota bacterium]|nr:hypothetical protein [Pseudomonadota bacterium]
MADSIYVKVIKNQWTQLKRFLDRRSSVSLTQREQIRAEVISELENYEPSRKQRIKELCACYTIQTSWKQEHTDQVERLLAALSQPGFSTDVILRFELGDYLWQLQSFMESANHYIQSWNHKLDINFAQLDSPHDIELTDIITESTTASNSLLLSFGKLRLHHKNIVALCSKGDVDAEVLKSVQDLARDEADKSAEVCNKGIVEIDGQMERLAAGKSQYLLNQVTKVIGLLDQTAFATNHIPDILAAATSLTKQCFEKASVEKTIKKVAAFRNDSPKRIIEQLALIRQIEEKQKRSTNQFRANLFLLSILVLMLAGIVCLAYYYFAAHLPVTHFAIGIGLVSVAFVSIFCHHIYQQRKIGQLNKYIHAEREKSMYTEPKHDGFVAVNLTQGSSHEPETGCNGSLSMSSV